MLPSPELQTKIALWRQKARDGTLTQEEMREGIKFLRAEREAMPVSVARAKAKPAINVAGLFDELNNL